MNRFALVNINQIANNIFFYFVSSEGVVNCLNK
ncbi:hypothetical protein Cycma_5025 [Cyclobacterium marinum DSM 745]|uniref:Uncharacterized protein n=1 Tax=Cyclobacterium marinum (strain ATCC 25205 / DSM 745 / LMG 13164 / NCIMB 1802) TaxID=880070 RepID=G0J8A9_CYCMS|nr:hypothetical protein Cycma_5025 [Cyclobacterium marinum DSM 745]